MPDDLDSVERRAKFVLDLKAVHRALGLPDDVRVVMLHVTRDPDRVHVTVEGSGVPVRELHSGQDASGLAWHGAVDAPVLEHPSAVFRIQFGGWKLGDPIDAGAAQGEPSDG